MTLEQHIDDHIRTQRAKADNEFTRAVQDHTDALARLRRLEELHARGLCTQAELTAACNAARHAWHLVGLADKGDGS